MEKFMRRTIPVLLMSAVLLAASAYAACGKTEPLFIVERSKNRNVVHYDACLKRTGDLSDIDPVTVYWVLENRKREGLSNMEKEMAYGISGVKRLGKNKIRIRLASIKDRGIVVEKAGGRYRAVILINGKESILEKVYVTSKDRIIGLPKVLSVDLYGRTRTGNLQVKERIAQ
jgi:hypothetical protein